MYTVTPLKRTRINRIPAYSEFWGQKKFHFIANSSGINRISLITQFLPLPSSKAIRQHTWKCWINLDWFKANGARILKCNMAQFFDMLLVTLRLIKKIVVTVHSFDTLCWWERSSITFTFYVFLPPFDIFMSIDMKAKEKSA